MAERKRTDALTVITKTYDLILWSCNHTGKFPRNHRFVLGEGIERNLYDLLEILIRAKYTRNRQELLEQANSFWRFFAFRFGLPKTYSASRSSATASQPRLLLRSANWSAAVSGAVAKHETPRQSVGTSH